MVEVDVSPVVLISGCSSGFGLNMSIVLARKGYRVIATMRNIQKKELLIQEASKAGVLEYIEIAQLDVTDLASIQNTVQHTISQHKKIDVLINNAGFALGGFVEEVELVEWKRQFDTNFFGAVALTKEVIPFMREQQKGTIVNISSISGQIGFPGLAPYVSSKFALEGFSESLRLELAPFHIRVVLIEPGAYKTEIWQKGLHSFQQQFNSPYEKQMENLIENVKKVAENANDPLEVTQTVWKAIQQKNSGFRYSTGKGTYGSILLKRLLPWSWFEKIVRKK